MPDEKINTPVTSERTWLEKIGHALLGEVQDQKDLITLLQDAKERDVLDEDALRMIEGVLEVAKMQVRDIMIPRSQMIVIARDAVIDDILQQVLESGHSRFPVIGEDRDDIIGILLAKELLAYTSKTEKQQFKILDIIRPATFVPESKRLNILLNEFRSKRNHMAIIIDEYGGVSGLITIEDVLEEIVGEIADETDIDTAENNINRNNETEYVIKALTPIDEFNTYFNSNFIHDDFDTIGGLIINRFGHLPKSGESITIDGFKFTIERADKRRIRTVIAEQEDLALDKIAVNKK